MANGWSRKPSEPVRVKNGRILHALSDVARQPTLITAWVNPLFVHLRLRSEAWLPWQRPSALDALFIRRSYLP